MRLCSIASGSSGNCIYVGSEETHVLVDTGISGKRIEQGLNQLELTGRDIDAILVTHEHSDHISGLGVMARRYHIPVYTTGGTADAISRMKNMKNFPEDTFHEIVEDQDFHIRDLTIHPFSIPHDAAQPVGYRVECEDKAVGIATDLGKYNDYIVDNLQNLKAVFLGHLSKENNYEALAYETVCSEVTLGDNPYRSKDFQIQVAKRDSISDVVVL